MSTDTYKYIWSNNEILKQLNELGYVHFCTKKSVNTMSEGKAFYFCPSSKKYGYVSVIPHNQLDNISDNINFVKEQYKKLKEK